MNLLFVQPKARDIAGIATGICYVATATQNAGHRAFGINLNHFSPPDHQNVLSSCIIENNIQVAFIGGTSGDFCEVDRITMLLKTIKQDIIVVIGGYLISTEPELVLRNTNADFGIIGPGDTTSVELLKALTHDFTKSSCAEIPGLIYLDDKSQLVRTRLREVGSFDFSRIPDLGLLFEFDIKKSKHIDLISSIGRPFNCTFCSRPIGFKKYDQRPLDSLFSELDHWLQIYDIQDITINDELFALNAQRVREFC